MTVNSDYGSCTLHFLILVSIFQVSLKSLQYFLGYGPDKSVMTDVLTCFGYEVFPFYPINRSFLWGFHIENITKLTTINRYGHTVINNPPNGRWKNRQSGNYNYITILYPRGA